MRKREPSAKKLNTRTRSETAPNESDLTVEDRTTLNEVILKLEIWREVSNRTVVRFGYPAC